VYPAIAVIVTAVCGAIWITLATRNAVDLANTHLHEVLAALQRTQGLLADAESGQRGFILTRRPAFLDPYDAAMAHLPAALDTLAALTKQEPEQARRLEHLRRLAAQHTAFLATAINDELAGRHAKALAATSSRQAERGMAAIRAQVASMLQGQERHLRVTVAAEARTLRAALMVAGAVTVLAIGLLVLLRRNVRSDLEAIRQRDSALHQREQELVAVNASLEQRVEQRTRELQEANAELERFAYAVAHDLRAPLRNVQGLAEAMAEDCAAQLDALGADYLQRIARTAQRMDILIRDLLAYAQLAREAMPLRDVDLGTALRAALEALETDIQGRRALVEVDGSLPRVRAHSTLLVQAFMNLLANAVKFVEPGVRPAVRISAHEQRDRVRVSVSDNGIGIDRHQTERLFRVFGRLHGQDSYPGTGLGLAMVKKAIERMGGRVGFESDRGHGSTFWLELPAGA
jgi:signal transduction histidine kinase